MPRCRTFRYSRRTRTRALEIFHRAEGNISALEIIAKLDEEGYGLVGRNALERWLREDPSRRATQAAALGQRLRHEAAAAHRGEDVSERLAKSANQLADLLAVTAKRAQRDISQVDIRTVDDLARVMACLRDISAATVEGFRAIAELRRMANKAENAQGAD